MKRKHLFVVCGLLAVLLLGGAGLNAVFDQFVQAVTTTEAVSADQVLKSISFEEAVIQKMNYDNISYAEAEAELLEAEERILTELGMAGTISPQNADRSNTIQYYNFSKTFTYPQNGNYSSELVATICTFLDDGTTRYIDSVLGVSSQSASATSAYEWVETIAGWSRISYDKRSVDLGATGYFTFTTSYSTTIVGFVSHTISGDVIYVSDPFPLLAIYRVS